MLGVSAALPSLAGGLAARHLWHVPNTALPVWTETIIMLVSHLLEFA